MSLPWFKLWDEAGNDPKLETLTDAQHRVWFKLMCMASRGIPRGTVGPRRLHVLAIQVARGDEALLLETLQLLEELDILAALDEGGHVFVHWQKRQKTSDRLPESQWGKLRAFVFARDDYTCTYCGQRGGQLECDHIIPHSRGGSDHQDNLTTACKACNQSKRDKTPEEWLDELD